MGHVSASCPIVQASQLWLPEHQCIAATLQCLACCSQHYLVRGCSGPDYHRQELMVQTVVLNAFFQQEKFTPSSVCSPANDGQHNCQLRGIAMPAKA